ncbi:hypothetical protein [Fluviicola taffensis]|uniref:Uncharacterized protein n=1 Tax=Fluviicola taffensis (strain DSM 16823 / NCIMB 13979 / RW262) TaxID=755732 RepID=F2IAY6_FLUTR|nr:hypothetical protein [Fluviicola taffensis]AEA45310.1 hypothetical protein Fluta_3338 [Fluviicola taffensis DSM 16823]
MKQIIFHSLLLLTFYFAETSLFAQNTQTNLIQNVQVQHDVVENGVKGIKVTTNIDLKPFQKKYNTDSLLNIALKTAKLSVTLTMLKDSSSVKSAYGYSFLMGKKECIEIKKQISLGTIEIDNSDCISFIPYAALKLTEGQQTISIQADLSGKDGFNATYKQRAFSTPVSFVKPATRLFELSLDSIQVKSFNAQGQAWDHSLFGADAPDLDFSIKMGNMEVGNIHKGNSYFISFPQKPRVFQFLVSENDEITVFLTDMDDVFHDQIASWRFDTANMKETVSYQQKESKAGIKAFSFRCKIGKLKG